MKIPKINSNSKPLSQSKAPLPADFWLFSLTFII